MEPCIGLVGLWTSHEFADSRDFPRVVLEMMERSMSSSDTVRWPIG